VLSQFLDNRVALCILEGEFPQGHKGPFMHKPAVSGQDNEVTPSAHRLRFKAWRITAIYAVFATLWIFFSDHALSLFVSDPASLVRWSVYKGLAFVALTSGLLLFLLGRTFGLIADGYASLQAKQHELHASEEQLAAIINTANDAIIAVDATRRITLFNPAALAMFACPLGEALGQPLEKIVPQLAEQDAQTGLVLQTQRWNGEPFSVEATLSRLPAGNRVALTVILRDITARQMAETSARNERQFSDTMIESMPGILYFYDTRGHFLRWNQNFDKVSGYSGDEISRMTPLDFFAEADRPLLQERIGEVFARGESSVEAPFRAKDGSAVPYFFTGRRVEYDGRPCLVGVGIDITERKQAEAALRQSEYRYRTTLDNILEGCQLIGHDWRYLYLNTTAATHNRRPNQELLGRTMPECWPGIESSRVFDLLNRCLKERIPLHEETEFTFMDGSRGWFDVRAQPVPEGIFVLSIDISERKQAEMALRVLNETLEQEVAGRTAELQATLVRAEAADRIKSAFLATMSHELRTPLNSIIGFTGIVLQELAGPLNAEQAKQLGMVRGSARHLLELINDVLDISKIEAGQLEVRAEPFDLGASIERVVASVKPLADKKQLALTVELPAELGTMVGDRRRVEQILINLLNNGIKFTDRGVVSLSVEPLSDHRCTPQAKPGPALRFQVKDSGMGIQPENLELLFQPFRQIDIGLSRQHEGTGLGLAICRRLAGLMGGVISASSQWQSGSEFTVVLPRERNGGT
jgi:PAS domain S-box-containing protein